MFSYYYFVFSFKKETMQWHETIDTSTVIFYILISANIQKYLSNNNLFQRSVDVYTILDPHLSISLKDTMVKVHKSFFTGFKPIVFQLPAKKVLSLSEFGIMDRSWKDLSDLLSLFSD